MIYGKVREKMQEVFKIYYIIHNKLRGRYALVCLNDSDPLIEIFKYDTLNSEYIFQGQIYSEDNFLKVLDLWIFS